MASKGRSGEEIAVRLLQSLGYEILETRKEVNLEGTGVAELDITAKDPRGTVYAVEVKSGKASVSDIRQVYANARFVGLKPMIICKGFSDRSTEVAIKRFKIRSLLLPEYYLINLEDVKGIVDELVADMLLRFEKADLGQLNEEEMRVLVELSEASSFTEAMRKSGMNRRAFGRAIGEIRKKCHFPLKASGFMYLSLQAKNLIRRSKETRMLTEILERVKSIDEKIRFAIDD